MYFGWGRFEHFETPNPGKLDPGGEIGLFIEAFGWNSKEEDPSLFNKEDY